MNFSIARHCWSNSAKKKALAEQMEDITCIEREIMGMTQDAMREIKAAENDEGRNAALDESSPRA